MSITKTRITFIPAIELRKGDVIDDEDFHVYGRHVIGGKVFVYTCDNCWLDFDKQATVGVRTPRDIRYR